MANLRDYVGRFSIHLFRGNAFSYTLQLADDIVLPEQVLIKSFRDSGFRSLLIPQLQGTATIDSVNRTLRIAYPASIAYPDLGSVQLIWDGRIVGAGELRCSTDTLDKLPSASGFIELELLPGQLTQIPFTADSLTAQYRAEVLEVAQQIREQFDNMLTYAGIDNQGYALLVAGDNVGVDYDNSGPYPAVTLTIP